MWKNSSENSFLSALRRRVFPIYSKARAERLSFCVVRQLEAFLVRHYLRISRHFWLCVIARARNQKKKRIILQRKWTEKFLFCWVIRKRGINKSEITLSESGELSRDCQLESLQRIITCRRERCTIISSSTRPFYSALFNFFRIVCSQFRAGNFPSSPRTTEKDC